jgi:hypothetical protein
VTDKIGYFVAAIIYLAILYTLVRPNSNGPTIIENLFSTMTDLVRGTVGYTYNTSSKSWEAPTNG